MQKKWGYALVLIIAGFIAFYLYQKYKVAPDLQLQKLSVADLNDQPVDLASLSGQKTVLCFAASWCGPCRKELKMISLIKDELLPEVKFIVISDEDPERIENFRQWVDFPFTWLRLKTPFSQVGINSIPTSYLVNTKGKIVKKTVGYLDWKDPSTSRHLSKLME